MFYSSGPLSDDIITQAVQNSRSISETVQLLGRSKVGSNFQLVRRAVERLNLSTTHWYNPRKRQPTDETRVFIEHGRTPRQVLRRIILRKNLIPYHCALCEIGPEWRGKTLVLRLDHHNGIRNDDRLENLRFLCPNCDSQTDTYCGRNRPKGKIRTHACPDCGVPTSGKRCRSCGSKYRHQTQPQPTKIVWPDTETLLLEVASSNMLAVARKLGVSDNALRKHLRNHASKPLVEHYGVSLSSGNDAA